MQLIHAKNYEELSVKAAEIIEKEISVNKKTSIALPGGSSVKGLLELLAGKQIEWNKVSFFMVDERNVSPNSDQSNFKQANHLLLSKTNAKIFPPKPAEPEKYTEEFLSETGGELDLLIVAAGEDGHIASIFPNKSIEKKEGYVSINDSPKPPQERISLTPTSISKSKKTILLFASESKRKAFEKFQSGISERECPAKLVLKSKDVIIITVFGESNE